MNSLMTHYIIFGRLWSRITPACLSCLTRELIPLHSSTITVVITGVIGFIGASLFQLTNVSHGWSKHISLAYNHSTPFTPHHPLPPLPSPMPSFPTVIFPLAMVPIETKSLIYVC